MRADGPQRILLRLLRSSRTPRHGLYCSPRYAATYLRVEIPLTRDRRLYLRDRNRWQADRSGAFEWEGARLA